MLLIPVIPNWFTGIPVYQIQVHSPVAKLSCLKTEKLAFPERAKKGKLIKLIKKLITKTYITFKRGKTNRGSFHLIIFRVYVRWRREKIKS